MCTSGYKVTYAHSGAVENFGTYDAAIAAVRSVFREATVGHTGDIDDGGEKTLCWPDEASSVNDSGARSCAVITRRYEPI